MRVSPPKRWFKVEEFLKNNKAILCHQTLHVGQKIMYFGMRNSGHGHMAEYFE